MSQSATEINEALQLYRASIGTEAEQVAYEHLNAVVERVKQQTNEDRCCGGRCRFCPVWREK